MSRAKYQVRLSGRWHPIEVLEIGQRFGHAARCKIGDQIFRSRDVPFGNKQAALESLMAAISTVHPTAEGYRIY